MRERNLLINSILFFFGSLGKGVASILVVFIASFYITPSNLGKYDLVISTLTLVQPIIIFQINDGIYRWMLEHPEHREGIISTGFKIAYRNMVIANIFAIFALYSLDVEHKVLIFILLNVNCIYPILQQITRGLKNHRIFAISGIFSAIIVLGLAYVLMKFFFYDINGIYIAQIVSGLFSILYLAISQRISFKVSFKKDESYSTEMQKYSIMLVPNSINQWIMKTLDKYCILFFMSPFENGIYTIAHRFPDMFIMLNNMFYSAWVEQSISEYNSDDRDEYFSKIYNTYSMVFTSVILLAIPITKYLLMFFAGESYQSAFRYVPFIYMSIIFSGLSSFIGTGYLGTKKTEGIMWTSLVGSLTNALVNIVFMKRFGLQIAGISSFLAYFFMWLFRLKQTKKFFSIKIKWGQFVFLMSVTFITALAVQLNNASVDLVLFVFALAVAVIINRNFIKNLFRYLVRKSKLER